MRLLQFEVLHGIIKSFKLLIHSLIDLSHLYLNISLENLLSLDTIIVLDSRRCFLGAIYTDLVSMLGSLTSGDT